MLNTIKLENNVNVKSISMVGREGVEPPKPKVPDLQSGAFDHFATDPYKR